MKREPAVEKEMSKLDTDKKMSKKEKEERVLWKKNEVSSIVKRFNLSFVEAKRIIVIERTLVLGWMPYLNWENYLLPQIFSLYYTSLGYPALPGMIL